MKTCSNAVTVSEEAGGRQTEDGDYYTEGVDGRETTVEAGILRDGRSRAGAGVTHTSSSSSREVSMGRLSGMAPAE